MGILWGTIFGLTGLGLAALAPALGLTAGAIGGWALIGAGVGPLVGWFSGGDGSE